MATNEQMEELGFYMANSGLWVRQIEFQGYTWSVILSPYDASEKSVKDIFDFVILTVCKVAYRTGWEHE